MDFKLFLESEEERFDSLSVEIPLPSEVRALGQLFREDSKSLFVVGGAVRDYLYKDYHLPGTSYKPKDTDLATEATPEEVVKILSSKRAKELGITVFPKGASFGVISAMMNGAEFEIATFREEWYDPDAGDGRRPDQVKYSTPAQDAKRRDLTINALFYDINRREIRDYNLDNEGKGQGIKDIQNKVVRPVGKAKDRFREDRLRIPRLVRFFSRFNDGDILKHLDEDTLEAVWEFRSLPGVSPERVAMEFIAGLKQSLKPVMFLRNYESLGLFPATFPNLRVDVPDFPSVKDVRNPHAVIAWLLKSNGASKAKAGLNKLKYPGSVFDAVEFLLHLYELVPDKIAHLLRRRDIYQQEKDLEAQAAKQRFLFQDVKDFGRISGREAEFEKFLNYKPQVQSADYMHLEPAQRGKKMAADERDLYFRD